MIDDQLRVEVYRLPACFERLKSKGIFNFCIRLLNQRSSSPILIVFFLLLLLESSKISLAPVYLVEITAGFGINLEAKHINFIDFYVAEKLQLIFQHGVGNLKFSFNLGQMFSSAKFRKHDLFFRSVVLRGHILNKNSIILFAYQPQ